MPASEAAAAGADPTRAYTREHSLHFKVRSQAYNPPSLSWPSKLAKQLQPVSVFRRGHDSAARSRRDSADTGDTCHMEQFDAEIVVAAAT